MRSSCHGPLKSSTAEEMRAWAQSILYPPGEPVLSGPYQADREGQLATARAEPDAMGDAEQDAAGFRLTPGEENECMSQYDADMDYCSAMWAMKPAAWGVCKERAGDRLGRCVAGGRRQLSWPVVDDCFGRRRRATGGAGLTGL